VREVDRRAASFADAAGSFLALVESLDATQWDAPAVEDGRAIGTVAHHVALGYAIGQWRVIAAASGYPQPLQQGTATERNAAHAAGTPAPDRDATLRLLRTGADALESAIRSLRDDQLDGEIRVGPVPGTTGRLVDSGRDHVIEHEITVRRSVSA